MTSPTGTSGARRVLVTGASSGIGRASAHQLAEQGARLVLCSRSRSVLDEVARECRDRGAADVVVAPADVGDREQVAVVFATARERYAGLDAVVHAAAVVAYGRFVDVPAEVFDRVTRTNYLGTANVAREALRDFEGQRGGTLVIVGSVLGKIATPEMSSYSASKWGVQGLARTLQVEARRTPGVRVGLVSPGSTDTPIYDLAATYAGRGGHPPPPVASAEWVARRVVAAVDNPRRDRNAGPANAVMVAGFRLLPGVYDRLVGPLMRLLGQGRTPREPTTGNVLEPSAEGEAVRGRWPHVWG